MNFVGCTIFLTNNNNSRLKNAKCSLMPLQLQKSTPSGYFSSKSFNITRLILLRGLYVSFCFGLYKIKWCRSPYTRHSPKMIGLIVIPHVLDKIS